MCPPPRRWMRAGAGTRRSSSWRAASGPGAASRGPFGEYPRTYRARRSRPRDRTAGGMAPGRAVLNDPLHGGREHTPTAYRAGSTACGRCAGPAWTWPRCDCRVRSCRLSAVVCATGTEATTAMMTLFLTASTLKHVTVVDDDVDISDDEQVAWAVAAQVQPDRDLLVVPKAKGSSLDPSAEHGLTAKLGLDATVGRRPRPLPADNGGAGRSVGPGRHLAELGDL
ncbi:hypothetical protein HBB16_03990 [Pseudonocardia sp. MCCB 268]|nr:hypothetical protein [Pseudonocardia cytotoxica]